VRTRTERASDGREGAAVVRETDKAPPSVRGASDDRSPAFRFCLAKLAYGWTSFFGGIHEPIPLARIYAGCMYLIIFAIDEKPFGSMVIAATVSGTSHGSANS
jgi:hypothetical protein